MKNNERTSIGIDKATLKIFQDFAKAMDVDLKSYMSLVAKYLERTGQDVTKDINTAQEVAKLKEQQIKFLKTFEKEKLGPISNEIHISMVEMKSLVNTIKGIREDHKRDFEEIDTLIRHGNEQTKNLQEYLSSKSEEAELKRVVNFLDSIRYTTLSFYKRLRSNILQKVANVPETLTVCEQIFEVYDKIFSDLFEESSYFENQKTNTTLPSGKSS